MDLFFVESPLQLLCAYEASCREEFECQGHKRIFILRLTSRGSNDAQMLNMAKDLGIEFKSLVFRPDKMTQDLALNFFSLCGFVIKKFRYIFFGSYHSGLIKLLVKFLRAKNVFYLDDGAATFRVQSEVQLLEKKPSLFTFFKIQPLIGQKIIFHRFSHLRNKLSHTVLTESDENININYFIGQPHEMMNSVSRSDYFAALEYTKKKTKSKLIYLAHRVDSEETLNFIQNELKVKIIKPNVCLEYYFLKENIIPYQVYSFYSTALITLSILNQKSEFYSFLLDKEKVAKDPALRDAYEFIEKSEINLIYRL